MTHAAMVVQCNAIISNGFQLLVYPSEEKTKKYNIASKIWTEFDDADADVASVVVVSSAAVLPKSCRTDSTGKERRQMRTLPTNFTGSKHYVNM